MNERAQLLALADDELVLGWRDSEWTGIAPVLEEDVAFSSIAQNEIGHARAIYQLLVSRSGAGEAGTSAPGRAPSNLRPHDADALAFDRGPGEYRSRSSSSCASSPTGPGRSRGECCTRLPTRSGSQR